MDDHIMNTQAAADMDDGGGETAVAVRGSMLPSVGNSDSTFEGRISVPFMEIAYGVGKLAKAGFVPGEIVIGGEHSVWTPAKPGKEGPSPLKIVIVSLKNFFKEYLSKADFDLGKKPRVFMSAAEASLAGLTTERDPVSGALPTAPAAMSWQLMVQKPENLESEIFCIEALGARFTPAVTILDKSNYGAVRDTFGKAVNFTLRDRIKQAGTLAVAFWDIKTRMYTAKTGNATPVYDIKLGKQITDAESKELLAAMVG